MHELFVAMLIKLVMWVSLHGPGVHVNCAANIASRTSNISQHGVRQRFLGAFVCNLMRKLFGICEPALAKQRAQANQFLSKRASFFLRLALLFLFACPGRPRFGSPFSNAFLLRVCGGSIARTSCQQPIITMPAHGIT